MFKNLFKVKNVQIKMIQIIQDSRLLINQVYLKKVFKMKDKKLKVHKKCYSKNALILHPKNFKKSMSLANIYLTVNSLKKTKKEKMDNQENSLFK